MKDANFSTLVLSLASSAVVAMGLEPSQKDKKDLEMAQMNIELLNILKEKTKGNLTQEEDKLTDQLLSDLKLQFIQVKEKS